MPTDPRQIALVALAGLVTGFYGWKSDPTRAGPRKTGDAFKKKLHPAAPGG